MVWYQNGGGICFPFMGETSQTYIIHVRGHLLDKEQVALQDRWPHKRGSSHMKFSMTGQGKGDHSL